MRPKTLKKFELFFPICIYLPEVDYDFQLMSIFGSANRENSSSLDTCNTRVKFKEITSMLDRKNRRKICSNNIKTRRYPWLKW